MMQFLKQGILMVSFYIFIRFQIPFKSNKIHVYAVAQNRPMSRNTLIYLNKVLEVIQQSLYYNLFVCPKSVVFHVAKLGPSITFLLNIILQIKVHCFFVVLLPTKMKLL